MKIAITTDSATHSWALRTMLDIQANNVRIILFIFAIDKNDYFFLKTSLNPTLGEDRSVSIGVS